jgi:hypothetical protein
MALYTGDMKKLGMFQKSEKMLELEAKLKIVWHEMLETMFTAPATWEKKADERHQLLAEYEEEERRVHRSQTRRIREL